MKTTGQTIIKKISRKTIVGILVVITTFAISDEIYAQSDTTKRGEISSNPTKKENPRNDDEIRTLFGRNRVTHGGFGAVSVAYSEFNKESALIVGGRGGWIINHCVSFGIGGYGITTNLNFDNIRAKETITLNGGYGGLYIELIAFPKQPVHLAFPILIGGGGMAYHLDNGLPTNTQSTDPDEFSRRYTFLESDAFFVLEPGVEIEMNVLRNFRVALGASYRYLGDLQLENTKSDALDGVSAGVTFKFGRF